MPLQKKKHLISGYQDEEFRMGYTKRKSKKIERIQKPIMAINYSDIASSVSNNYRDKSVLWVIADANAKEFSLQQGTTDISKIKEVWE